MNKIELDIRYNLLKDIESLIQKYLPDSKVFMFGSTANRLALPDSDIDVLVCIDHVKESSTYNILYETIYHIILDSK